ncbi:hypothetical protein PR003_g31257 [Phytophthora rubi]|uniref:Uncharacterized protein n=1 Tax=Phytophthora rubi TaxID=129364 RepID=A0A6A4B6W9_9STRA|nr:hypothetical protein PR002_g30063 [Phytophthora rubi]KAE9269034.1 hypothetical protein PR003_g31257 [Phytophthora rubi]
MSHMTSIRSPLLHLVAGTPDFIVTSHHRTTATMCVQTTSTT